MMTSSKNIHPPRHCMIVFAIYPLGETRVQREAEALINRGYNVDVICVHLPGESVVDSYKGVKIFREESEFPIPFLQHGGLAKKFLDYLRFFISAGIRVTREHLQKPYDTLQVHNLPDFLVFCTLIPKLMGVPIILDLHDLMPEFFAGRFEQTDSLGAKLIRFQERLACKYADHVITVSEHWKEALIYRGVPANKCSVIMNVADDHIFFPNNNKHDQTSPRNEFKLVYHGTLTERYGLDLALRAIDIVRHEIPGIHLKLIGRGDYVPILQQMIDELGINQYVSVDGLHLAEELPGIIQSCDLGIVPYRNDIFTDGLLPTKLMEYAALGMPAIAARTTAIQAYFTDTNVEFFEPGNVEDLSRVIKYLYHNPDRLDQLAQGCQNFNTQYNWTKISAEYLGIVDNIRGKDNTIEQRNGLI